MSHHNFCSVFCPTNSHWLLVWPFVTYLGVGDDPTLRVCNRGAALLPIPIMVLFLARPIRALSPLNTSGWTRLPLPRGSNGTTRKLSTCIGCHLALSLERSILRCTFAHTSFDLPTVTSMQPCGIHHITLAVSGSDLLSQHIAGRWGLCFPNVHHWGTFICELSTVRAVVGRESCCSIDASLLQLEHMQLIDVVNFWVAAFIPNTSKNSA